MRIQRALISVSNKTGVVEFARGLAEMGWTGLHRRHGKGTRRCRTAGHPCGSVTGFPEMMEGRVKTLHPRCMAASWPTGASRSIWSRPVRTTSPIDLVCVNLYPFAETVAKPRVSTQDAIENIDIGGPAMVRSAAKNHASVAVVVDPNATKVLAGCAPVAAACLRRRDGSSR